MWKYFEHLPLKDRRNIASLGEGNTPLVRSVRLGPALGVSELYFKIETQNPTGSYKDRFASVAVSLMLEEGKRKIVASSSGNTGAALAAYAARFCIEIDLYVLEQPPEEKLVQSLSFGARVFRVRGLGASLDVEEELMSRLFAKSRACDAVSLVSAFSTNPREMQGVKTVALELAEQMKPWPDHLFVPVGGGGLLLSCFKAFAEVAHGEGMAAPRLHAVQPAGCATVAGPLLRGETTAQPVECTSRISGLQVASVLDGQEVLEAVLFTGGSGQVVSDEDIYHWQRRLIREEGIYAEPAAAASLAGLASAAKKGLISEGERVVCLITGSGFKDNGAIRRLIGVDQLPLINVEEI
jgi:threonine synthase